MKKIISLALALILVMGLATVAFAQDVEPDTPTFSTENPYVVKRYDPNGGKAPQAEFSFTIAARTTKPYEDNGAGITKGTIPTLYIGTANYKKPANGTTWTNITEATDKNVKIYTDENKTTFDVSTWDVGSYYYTIKETEGTVAGVEYSTQELTLQIVVTNGESGMEYKWILLDAKGDKTTPEGAPFVNTYKHGTVTVTKKITGENANMDATFRIKVTLTLPTGKTLEANDGIIVETGFSNNDSCTSFDSNGKREMNKDNDVKQYVMFGNEDTYTFSNLPVDTTIEVEEVNYGEYTVTYKVDDGEASDTKVTNATVPAGGTTAVVVTNNLSGQVDTGVVLDSMPYILLLTLAAAGMFLLLTKKRAREF